MQKQNASANDKGTQFKKSKVDEIFNLVKMENGKIAITIGNAIVSKKQFRSYPDAEKYLAQKPYEILINVACLILNSQKNEKETKQPQEIAESNKEA